MLVDCVLKFCRAFEEESIVKALTNFQTKLVAKMLEKKGWTFKKGEDKVEAMFKALVFSNGGSYCLPIPLDSVLLVEITFQARWQRL